MQTQVEKDRERAREREREREGDGEGQGRERDKEVLMYVPVYVYDTYIPTYMYTHTHIHIHIHTYMPQPDHSLVRLVLRQGIHNQSDKQRLTPSASQHTRFSDSPTFIQQSCLCHSIVAMSRREEQWCPTMHGCMLLFELRFAYGSVWEFTPGRSTERIASQILRKWPCLLAFRIRSFTTGAWPSSNSRLYSRQFRLTALPAYTPRS